MILHALVSKLCNFVDAFIGKNREKLFENVVQNFTLVQTKCFPKWHKLEMKELPENVKKRDQTRPEFLFIEIGALGFVKFN